MIKDILNSLKEELKQIKKEGNVEEINVENVDVEERKIHDIKQRKMKKSFLRKGLIIGATAVALVTVPVNVLPIGTAIEVQAAKKDKKKPKITFKGNTKINTTKGKSIKIPKTTAKDNKDGNVTKKINVVVKKDNKSYSSIAKKIQSNKSVKFAETGTYVITYTVKDKAGNKATKKRYVTVKNLPKNIDYEKYGIKKITINGITYNVTNNKKFKTDYINKASSFDSENFKISFANDYIDLFISSDCDYEKDSKYLKYYGKLNAYDKNNKNISSNAIIYEEDLNNMGDEDQKCFYTYASDSNGNASYEIYHLTSNVIKLSDLTEEKRTILKTNGFTILNENPVIIGKLKSYLKKQSVTQNKGMVLKK